MIFKCIKSIVFLHLIIILNVESSMCQTSKLNTGTDEMLLKLTDEAAKAETDTAKLRLYTEIYHYHYNMDSILKYSKLAETMAEKLNDKEQQAEALMFSGAYYSSGVDNQKASEYFYNALYIWKTLDNTTKEGICYNCLAVILDNLNDKISSNEYYTKALRIFSSNKDSVRCARIYRCLSNNYKEYRIYEIAEEYAEKALSIDLPNKDYVGISFDILALGYVSTARFANTGDTTYLYKAKTQYLKAYKNACTANFLEVIVEITTQLQGTYMEIANAMTSKHPKFQQMIDSCNYYENIARECIEKMGDDIKNLQVDINESQKLMLLGKYKEAKEILDKNDKNLRKNLANYGILYYEDLCPAILSYYKYTQNYKKYLELNEEREKFNHKRYGMDYVVDATKEYSRIQFENRIAKIDADRNARKESLENENKILLYGRIFLAVVGSIVIFLCVYNKRNLKITAQLNNDLEIQTNNILMLNEKLQNIQEHILEQSQEIKRQRDEIKEKKDSILSNNRAKIHSIQYASKIQCAAMPTEEMLQDLFGDYILIFKPLEIVSGDFYWARKIGNLKIACVADCTGHGIPGGLLSILGISILNQISQSITEQNTAADILSQLRKKIIDATVKGNMDGMDASVCIINESKRELQFAGAMRPCLMLQNNSLIKLKEDRMPVGRHFFQTHPFTNHKINYNSGDRIYMFTDGIVDILGGEKKGKRAVLFNETRLRKIVEETSQLSLSQQKTEILTAMNNWQKNFPEEQNLDDQLLIGISLK